MVSEGGSEKRDCSVKSQAQGRDLILLINRKAKYRDLLTTSKRECALERTLAVVLYKAQPFALFERNRIA
jgi:hypothetical protein